MNKIETIEQELKHWKAVYEKEDTRYFESHTYAEGMVDGLESALETFKEPPNTAIQIDTKPECNKCKPWKFVKIGCFCPDCGRALSD